MCVWITAVRKGHRKSYHEFLFTRATYGLVSKIKSRNYEGHLPICSWKNSQVILLASVCPGIFSVCSVGRAIKSLPFHDLIVRHNQLFSLKNDFCWFFFSLELSVSPTAKLSIVTECTSVSIGRPKLLLNDIYVQPEQRGDVYRWQSSPQRVGGPAARGGRRDAGQPGAGGPEAEGQPTTAPSGQVRCT